MASWLISAPSPPGLPPEAVRDFLGISWKIQASRLHPAQGPRMTVPHVLPNPEGPLGAVTSSGSGLRASALTALLQRSITPCPGPSPRLHLLTPARPQRRPPRMGSPAQIHTSLRCSFRWHSRGTPGGTATPHHQGVLSLRWGHQVGSGEDSKGREAPSASCLGCMGCLGQEQQCPGGAHK